MKPTERPAFGVLLAICFCHAINDMLQSLLAAAYPVLKAQFGLTFAQVGFVTLAYQLTASLLQPLVGVVSDRRPVPFSLPAGTLFTFAGLIALAAAGSYPALVAGACVLGVGSSVFHPESSRVARMAAADRPGLAQSLFQVGGNVGSALGPLGAALVVLRWGQRGIGAFAAFALLSTAVLVRVGLWVRREGHVRLATLGAARGAAFAGPDRAGAPVDGPGKPAPGAAAPGATASARGPVDPRRIAPSRRAPSRRHVGIALGVLLMLVFSKFIYLASIVCYYTFYLIERFGISVADAQLHLVAFSGAVALGTLAGGPLGDRLGRKPIIWLSILGALPFTLALPYVDLFWTGVLSVIVGFILASAFPAIVVYGQELLPGRVGMVSGLFFGLSFGAAGAGAAWLGQLADKAGIEQVYRGCAYLPALGLLAALLPSFGGRRSRPSAVPVLEPG